MALFRADAFVFEGFSDASSQLASEMKDKRFLSRSAPPPPPQSWRRLSVLLPLFFPQFPGLQQPKKRRLSEMPSRYVLEVTVVSAQGLKNVNRRHGPTLPYAVVWVDPNNKRSTRVDDEGHTSPIWNHSLVITLPLVPIEDATLSIHVVHAGSEEDTQPLIGWAWISLRDVLDEAGFGNTLKRSLQLMRPSGRPQGEVVVEVCMRELRYRASDSCCGPPNGVPHLPPQPNSHYATPPLAFAVGAVVGALGGLLAWPLAFVISEGARRAFEPELCGTCCERSEPRLEPETWSGSGFWLGFFCLVLIFSLAHM
ncbi:hypothetical protein ACJRO7_002877 [Eucalyptus globulus]|uniref:C2 domain-containing protein n=1 Tax=Eucalyptus globulus TaxID=34317 RepID=A0ABD3LVV9_EUCGL